MGSENMMNGYGMMGGWGIGPLFMLLILGLLIAFIVMVIKFLTGNSRSATPSAIEILEERFARGEIDETEFQNREKQLGRLQ